MNVKKTMLVAVALATVVTTSFAAKTNPDLQAVDEKEQADPSEGHYKAPKSYGWSVIALGLATPVQLPWGIEKWDIFGLDLNLGYSDSMKMYGWEFAFGANTARKCFIGLQTAVGIQVDVHALFFVGLQILDIYLSRDALEAALHARRPFAHGNAVHPRPRHIVQLIRRRCP